METMVAETKNREKKQKQKRATMTAKLEHARYKKIIKKLDNAITEQTKTPLHQQNKSLLTNLHDNSENLTIKASQYANDRGGYQFKGRPENWYVAFSEQARMLYR